MRMLAVLIVLLGLAGCHINDADSNSTAALNPIAKAYDDVEQLPQSVRTVIDVLKEMTPGCSIDEFQTALGQNKAVETPYRHVKDFEIYWSIENESKTPPSFVIAGAFFFSDDERKLIYSTVNIVEESGGKWRTVWCIEYNPSGVTPIHPPKLWGLSNDE